MWISEIGPIISSALKRRIGQVISSNNFLFFRCYWKTRWGFDVLDVDLTSVIACAVLFFFLFLQRKTVSWLSRLLPLTCTGERGPADSSQTNKHRYLQRGDKKETNSGVTSCIYRGGADVAHVCTREGQHKQVSSVVCVAIIGDPCSSVCVCVCACVCVCVCEGHTHVCMSSRFRSWVLPCVWGKSWRV